MFTLFFDKKFLSNKKALAGCLVKQNDPLGCTVCGKEELVNESVERERYWKMKKDDVEILREVQKNTEMAMKAIETMSDKIYDDNLAMQLSRQSLKYSEIHNKALDKILEGRAEPYRANHISQMMLVGGIHSNTMFNTSTSHIAELMILGSSRGITDLWKALNHHEQAGKISLEIAKELMDFEEKNMERLKRYL